MIGSDFQGPAVQAPALEAKAARWEMERATHASGRQGSVFPEDWVHEQVASNFYRLWARCIVPLPLAGEYNDKSFVDPQKIANKMVKIIF